MICKKLCLLLIPLVVTAVWADQVTLKNGDRVTGKIQKKEGTNLVIKSDVFGAVTIPWDAVTSIVSDEPLNVVLPDGKTVAGKISTEQASVAVATPTARESIPIEKVDTIRNADEQVAFERLQNPGWGMLWAGYADFGWSLAAGNSESSTVSTAVRAGRSTRRDKTSFYFNQIFAKGKRSDGITETTAEAIRGGLAYNRNISPRIFLNAFNDYEYDAFQNLDLRFVLGGGAGVYVVRSERTQLDLLGGGAYNREKFSTPLTRNSGEVYWGNTLLHKLSGSMTLTQSFRMFQNLSEGGEYRMNFDVGQATRIKDWLSWQLTFSDRYLSNPVPGKKQNDLLLTTGVRFTFAR